MSKKRNRGQSDNAGQEQQLLNFATRGSRKSDSACRPHPKYNDTLLIQMFQARLSDAFTTQQVFNSNNACFLLARFSGQ